MIIPYTYELKSRTDTLFDFRFTFSTGTIVDPTLVNLTNWTGVWSVDINLNPPNLYASSNTLNQSVSGLYFGGDSHDLTTGIIDLVLIPNDLATFYNSMDLLNYGYPLYSLNLTSAGQSFTLMSGNLTITGS